MVDTIDEVWQSQAPGRIVVKKRGEYGVEVEEMVHGVGRKLHITDADRRMNQERAASDTLDVFQNGMLAPLSVGSKAEEFAANPNLLTEDDMIALVGAHPKTFEKKLAGITNPLVVERILEIAKDQDVTVKREAAIKAHLEEIIPIKTNKVESHKPDDRAQTTFAETKV